MYKSTQTFVFIKMAVFSELSAATDAHLQPAPCAADCSSHPSQTKSKHAVCTKGMVCSLLKERRVVKVSRECLWLFQCTLNSLFYLLSFILGIKNNLARGRKKPKKIVKCNPFPGLSRVSHFVFHWTSHYSRGWCKDKHIKCCQAWE